jgi:hypothetical protein
MRSKYFLIPIITASLFLIGISVVPTATFGRTLTVQSIYLYPLGDNATSTLNGTRYIINGTDEQIANKYYELGEDFDKQVGVKVGDPVKFIFKNGSAVTVSYTGEYRNPASEQLLRDVLVPLGEPGDIICWTDEPDLEIHYVCGHE